jgi:hypothetical protein
MALLGQHSVRCKIIVDKCLQQVKNVKNFSCEISYETEKVIQQKLAKVSEILGILNNIFEPTLVQKFSRIKVCYTLGLLILLYGSEIWTFRKKIKK